MPARIRITVKVPEIVLNSAVVRNAIIQKMRSNTGPELSAEFRKTVNGWQDAPNFSQSFYNGTDKVSVTVQPTGKGTETYNLVNKGSPPHLITPRRGGILRFQTGYRAATSPRVIGSRSKSRYGSFSAALAVRHPGFEARAFAETIAERYEDTFVADMQDAIRIAVVRR